MTLERWWTSSLDSCWCWPPTSWIWSKIQRLSHPVAAPIVCARWAEITWDNAHATCGGRPCVFQAHGHVSLLLKFKIKSEGQCLQWLCSIFTCAIEITNCEMNRQHEPCQDVNESLMWIYRLFPGFCLGHGLFELPGGNTVLYHSQTFPTQLPFFRLFDPFGSCALWQFHLIRYSVFIFLSSFHFLKSFLWIAFRFRPFCKISPSLHIHQFHDLSSRTPRICTNSVISRQLNTEVALLDWDVAGKDALCMCPRTV